VSTHKEQAFPVWSEHTKHIHKKQNTAQDLDHHTHKTYRDEEGDVRAFPTKREMHAPFLLLVTPPSASLLVDGLLHAHGLAGVNHVLGEAAALHVQGVDADIDARDAIDLQRRDGNGDDLRVGRKRVALAGGKHVLDAAVDVDVHVADLALLVHHWNVLNGLVVAFCLSGGRGGPDSLWREKREEEESEGKRG